MQRRAGNIAHAACMVRGRCADVVLFEHMAVRPLAAAGPSSGVTARSESIVRATEVLALSFPPRSWSCARGWAASVTAVH